jgi:surface protein
MFTNSEFNRDISKWNVSKVVDMDYMFGGSKFNQDISNWDVSKVASMTRIFSNSSFSGNVNTWKPLKLINSEGAFDKFKGIIPPWNNCTSNEEVLKKISAYNLHQELYNDLENHLNSNKNLKL